MAKKQEVAAPGKQTRCGSCGYYAALETPFHYEKTGYPEGVTVYGFCTKDVNRLRSFYPVYLPDGGECKAFKKGKKPSEEERRKGYASKGK